MGQASRIRILRLQREAEAEREKTSFEDDGEELWPDLEDEPPAQLEAEPAEPQAVERPVRVMARSWGLDPPWRRSLVQNRAHLRNLKTREATVMRRRAELVGQALDVGAAPAHIATLLGVSRRTFYDRYGQMVQGRKQ